jgi:hypothetical protein
VFLNNTIYIYEIKYTQKWEKSVLKGKTGAEIMLLVQYRQWSWRCEVGEERTKGKDWSRNNVACAV